MSRIGKRIVLYCLTGLVATCMFGGVAFADPGQDPAGGASNPAAGAVADNGNDPAQGNGSGNDATDPAQRSNPDDVNAADPEQGGNAGGDAEDPAQDGNPNGAATDPAQGGTDEGGKSNLEPGKIDDGTDKPSEPDSSDEPEPPAPVETESMFRMYNAYSGEHFYTADSDEKDYLVRAGWLYEGVGWNSPVESQHPIYRLYNSYAGDHHYTLDIDERDFLVSEGWTDEGIGWYSDDAETVAIYRQYNPHAITGAHNFTGSIEELAALVGYGWDDEGVAWYAVSLGDTTPSSGSLRISQQYAVVNNISGSDSVVAGYNTTLDAQSLAAVNQCLNTDVDLAFVALNPVSGKSIARSADMRFYGASTIKAPYIAALCKYDAPGIFDVTAEMYDAITFSSNEAFNTLCSIYGRYYEDAFASESTFSLEYPWDDSCYVNLSPRELALLWVTIRQYLTTDDTNVQLFRSFFGNGGFFKEGWMYDGSHSGQVYHLAGVEGDTVYAIMSRYMYRDEALWNLRDALLRAVS